MKKILLLLAVCTLTTVNAARPLTIMNETDNYILYGNLIAKNSMDCNDKLTVFDIEMHPGDLTTAAADNNSILNTATVNSISREVYHNETRVPSNNFRNKSTELFINGYFEWSSFNFKIGSYLYNDGFGGYIKFIEDQACDNDLPYQWTGGNGTSIVRLEPYAIGEHMYMIFIE